MCGIVGYIGKQSVKNILIDGLHRLEYRGYDSAGLSVLENGVIRTVKAVGKVVMLEEAAKSILEMSHVGIAHTRWATHGKPSELNSHPHTDCLQKISLVHNGIIENYTELKSNLESKGHVFQSETDSEVVAHLLEESLKNITDFEQAFAEVLRQLRGTFGIAVIYSDIPDSLFVAKKGSPLIIGVGDDESMIASDVSAMVGYVPNIVFLDENEIGIVRRDGYRILSLDREIKEREMQKLEWTWEEAQKGGYPHFMLKEIFEQPRSFEDALRGRLLIDEGRVKLGGLESIADRLHQIERIIIISCGTSYHTGLVGEYMLEEFASIPVEVEYASEFRYRRLLLNEHTLVIALSQSGETADTLAAIREAKARGALTIGIVNVVGSSIARLTDAGIYNHAGPEVSVASTKAFTSQLAILALLTVYFGRMKGMSEEMGKQITQALHELPSLIDTVLEGLTGLQSIAEAYQDVSHFLYLGRKYSMPIALEGALKIKEIAYVGAQGYPTGEMKHGPIALIDENSVCLLIVPEDSVYEKSVSGLEEIKARGGRVVAITTQGNQEIAKKADYVVYIPKTIEMLTPILSVLPLQLFSYYFSVAHGYDVDRPRNLAKSVTVE